MTSPTDTDTDPAQLVRARLHDGRVTKLKFAEGVDRSQRTIETWIAAGMPCEWVGRTPYIVVEPAIAWLRARKTRDLEPRGRGRPRSRDARGAAREVA